MHVKKLVDKSGGDWKVLLLTRHRRKNAVIRAGYMWKGLDGS